MLQRAALALGSPLGKLCGYDPIYVPVVESAAAAASA
jgi:hypothetical protein